LGGKYVSGAEADGYTLLASQVGSLTIAPSLYKLDYDPLKDLAPVAIISETPQIVVVTPSLPVKTLAELFAYAKANPGTINFGSPGVGTQPHLLGELLQIVGNVKFLHVPFRGSAPAITELLAGRVQIMFESPSVMLPHIQANDVRALTVTSEKRIAQIPDVPTVGELRYPRLKATLWTGLVAPAGTPRAVVDKLNAAVNQSLKSAEAQQSFQRLAVETHAISPPQLAAFMAAETRKWADVIAQAGVKAE
jgi:tripartite-type tricarboxylate transporter receptor subunit TctC